jgi:hypothetical protein
MATHPQRREEHAGPSPGIIAWRRFLVETVLCIVLVIAIAVVVLGASHDIVASPVVAALVAAILRIVWRP